jgi:hypothetical protein
VGADIAFGEHFEALDELGGEQALARTDQRDMEFAVAHGHFATVPGGGGIEHVKGVAGGLPVGLVGVEAGIGRRRRFDGQTQQVDFLGLVFRHRAHEPAAVGLAGQQSLVLQPGQRLAQGILLTPSSAASAS